MWSNEQLSELSNDAALTTAAIAEATAQAPRGDDTTAVMLNALLRCLVALSHRIERVEAQFNPPG